MTLSKTYILENTSSIAIYNSECSEIDDSLVGSSGNTRKNISSPFRSGDKQPSFSIYRDKSGRIKFKDHGTGDSGDEFDFVARMNNLDINSQFPDVLNRICETQGISISKPKNINTKYLAKYSKEAINFFDAYKIKPEIAKLLNVRQLKYFYDNQNKKKYQSIDGIVIFDFIVNGRSKIYIPKQEKVDIKIVRCHQNSNDVFGLSKLGKRKLDYVLIVEGEKDCLVALSYGIPAISFQSATRIPNVETIRSISQICKLPIVLYDNDDAGVKGSKTLNNKFGFPIFNIPNNYNDLAEFLPQLSTKDVNAFKEDVAATYSEFIKESFYSIQELNQSYYKNDNKISNFIIQAETLIECDTYSERIVKLVSRDRSTDFFTINTDDLASLSNFKKRIERKGNFLFFGSERELMYIKERIFKFSGYCVGVTHLGFKKLSDDREVFLFSNKCIDHKGEIFTPSNLGVISDLNIYIPSSSDSNSNNADYRIDQRFSFRSGSKFTTSIWLETITNLWNEQKAIVGFSFIFSSLFWDYIFNYKRRFPILNVWGQKGQGKGTYTEFLYSFFNAEKEPVMFPNANPVAITRSLGHRGNVPTWVDEFRNQNSINKYQDKIEILKNTYDGIGKTMGVKSNDNRTRKTDVRAPLILSGQDQPQDEALFSRTISLRFETIDKSKSRDFEILMRKESKKGFGNILIDLLKYRHLIVKHFEEEENNIQLSLKQKLTNLKVQFEERLINNYTTIITPLSIAFKNGLDINTTDTFDSIIDRVFIPLMVAQAKEEVNKDEKEQVFSLIGNMIREEITLKGNVWDFDREKKHFFFSISFIKTKISEYLKRIGDTNKLDLNSALTFLRDHRSYVKLKNNRRSFNAGQHRSMIFEFDLLPDSLQEIIKSQQLVD